jgi:hypothetical protein
MPHPLTRRGFIQAAAYSATAIALRGQTIAGANDQVRLGLIGCGRRAGALAPKFAGLKNVKIVAVSDPDTAHMDKISTALSTRKDGAKPAHFLDYRKLLERDDIDAVVIASPHHWHALHTIHACQAGKDVYVEKPLSHDIWEGRQMIAAAKRYDRIVQVGSQNRHSWVRFPPPPPAKSLELKGLMKSSQVRNFLKNAEKRPKTHRETESNRKVIFLPVVDVSPEFPNAVAAARDEGKDERTFCLWLWPPF